MKILTFEEEIERQDKELKDLRSWIRDLSQARPRPLLTASGVLNHLPLLSPTSS
jgi:hypothetical protein